MMSGGRCYCISLSCGESAISEHFRGLGDELARRGNRVSLFLTGQPDDVGDSRGNPAVHAWPSRRPTRLVDAVFLAKQIARCRPDCLVGSFSAVNWMLLVGRMMRVPCRVACSHTLSAQIDCDSPLPRWKRRGLMWRKRLVLRTASFVWTNSDACQQDVMTRFHVPPVKCIRFQYTLRDPLEDGAVRPRPISRPDAFVCVGRLNPSKGQDVVVRAARILAGRVPNLLVEFVGDGPCRQSLTELARQLGVESCCRFLDRLSHEEVLDKMSSATATIVPSRFEAFGLVNIESMAVGTPVVASDTGGIGEIIRDGVDGFLVPPDQPEKLAERLLRISSNAELARRLREQARRRFLDCYEQRHAIRRQADILENLVAEASARRNGSARGRSGGEVCLHEGKGSAS
ncbi:MAG: glycosyltransferase family 4 protein [Pirellulales bacterium]|nr:glycosyltransferase family 4 protein [Pirellulales bacterium]